MRVLLSWLFLFFCNSSLYEFSLFVDRFGHAFGFIKIDRMMTTTKRLINVIVVIRNWRSAVQNKLRIPLANVAISDQSRDYRDILCQTDCSW